MKGISLLKKQLNKPHDDCYSLVLDRKEIVVPIDVKLTMDVVLHHEDLVVVDYLKNFVDLDDEDYEHTELFQLLLDKIQNYYNHLVVFFDNNLIKR